MLNSGPLEASLPIEGLGEPLYVFPIVESTNDEAKKFAEQGAPQGTLILAEAQSRGRGRQGRRWFTESGSGLALSLVLRPKPTPEIVTRLTVMGALAVTECLIEAGAKAWIKWPNDVIVTEGKVAGVLVEATWVGEELDYVVLGIGVNVHPASIPPHTLTFPASCVDDAVGYKIDRQTLLVNILGRIGYWYHTTDTEAIVQAWENSLAYRNQQVQLSTEGTRLIGTLEGLAPDGRLRLALEQGDCILVDAGDLSLRPIDSEID
jgi:BirA family biotin operon repressor/biotin-[acetyl-CoA-carboxylase] ligase